MVSDDQRRVLHLALAATKPDPVLAARLDGAIARATATRTPDPIASALIFAAALAILYRWKSKLATPAVLAIGALVGAVVM